MKRLETATLFLFLNGPNKVQLQRTFMDTAISFDAEKTGTSTMHKSGTMTNKANHSAMYVYLIP